MPPVKRAMTVNLMRNFPETGERVINTKKNSPLRRGASQVQRTLFLGIGHSFTCVWEILLYIQTKLVTNQYQFQQDNFGVLFILKI